MSQAPKTMPQKNRRTPRSARKITLGVIGGISARNCCPAAAPTKEPPDRGVVLGRRRVPVICLSPLAGPSASGQAGSCRELIPRPAAQKPAHHAEELGREYPRWVAQHLGGPPPGVSQVPAAERQLG